MGQRLEFDLSFEIPDCDAMLTDRVEDTVDYAEVCDIVALAATERSYRTLERLGQVVGERLMERFDCESVGFGRPSPSRRSPTRSRRPRWRSPSSAPPSPATRTRMTERLAERAGYLGLGSNVGEREARSRPRVGAMPSRGSRSRRSPPLYETEPVGEVLDQPDFLNAAARVRTALEPEELLDVCKRIEAEQGRESGGPRHGPRPIDVDLLLLGDIELETERLTLPHPEVPARRFVLLPLLELDPALVLPDGTKLRTRSTRSEGPGGAPALGATRARTSALAR